MGAEDDSMALISEIILEKICGSILRREAKRKFHVSQ